MRSKKILALFIGVSALPCLAHAAGLSPEQLEKLSQTRQNDLGARNWGKPLPATPLQKKIISLQADLTCMSPVSDFVTVYEQPDITSRQIGKVTSQVAATNDVKNGFRKILYAGKQYGWMPNRTLVAFRPLVPGGTNKCVVVGENEKGIVLFTHPLQ